MFVPRVLQYVKSRWHQPLRTVVSFHSHIFDPQFPGVPRFILEFRLVPFCRALSIGDSCCWWKNSTPPKTNMAIDSQHFQLEVHLQVFFVVILVFVNNLIYWYIGDDHPISPIGVSYKTAGETKNHIRIHQISVWKKPSNRKPHPPQPATPQGFFVAAEGLMSKRPGHYHTSETCVRSIDGWWLG